MRKFIDEDEYLRLFVLRLREATPGVVPESVDSWEIKFTYIEGLLGAFVIRNNLKGELDIESVLAIYYPPYNTWFLYRSEWLKEDIIPKKAFIGRNICLCPPDTVDLHAAFPMTEDERAQFFNGLLLGETQ